MTSDVSALIVLLVIALALLAATLAGLWLYVYATTFDPAMTEAIGHLRDMAKIRR